MEIVVLRVGHRPERDKRVSTHVCLVARAFGASGILIDREDKRLESKISDLVDKWGGEFWIRSGINWKREIKERKKKGWRIVHLTMYGINVDDVINEIRKYEKILVIVGSEKVPREIYDLADLNVAIGNQPHSEISALAILLDRIFSGEELKREFKNCKIRIIPSKRGKTVLRVDSLGEE
ncbi:MAG TPA: tRNA (cytidine(56)-2'-O)-methyltransferase [Euryarchaeota archaeon]|nr:MAG: tRNA (cytidine(56)-2'-O)-methyltransferase [Thermococci archaeon]HDI10631.1 tRNA (cytidine(56)-2'-O)-methyltransferase [Euryarchaeota archaeon]